MTKDLYITNNYRDATFLYGDSINNPDIYYHTNFISVDPIAYIEVENHSFLIVHDFELKRAKQESFVNNILSFNDLGLNADIIDKYKGQDPAIKVLSFFLNKLKIKRLVVPRDFSAYDAFFLKNHGFSLNINPDNFKNKRIIKTENEIDHIKIVHNAILQSIHVAEDIIKSSKINNELLFYNNECLTSELLRIYIQSELLKHDCFCENIIVSAGKNSFNPHDFGYGPIKKDVPIVIDVYPRHNKNRYYADVSRTFIKGKPSDQILKMYETVLTAQNETINSLKAGVNVSEIYEIANSIIQKEGYNNSIYSENHINNNHSFSLGHGVGLSVHEAPSINSFSTYTLEENNVITIEPGIYSKYQGGIRLEDMIVIKNDSSINLTSYPKDIDSFIL